MEVIFADGASMIVDGELVARGKFSQPIMFKPTVGIPAVNWGQIKFTSSGANAIYDSTGEYIGGSIMEFCTIELAGSAGLPAVSSESIAPFITNCTVKNNSKIGISIIRANTEVRFVGNNVDNNGDVGLMVSDSTNVIIENNTITGNFASGPNSGGGGIFLNSVINTVIASNTIKGNTATGVNDGGGLRIGATTATVTSNTISDNSTDANGGGLWMNITDSAAIVSNTITSNIGREGGAIFINVTENSISVTENEFSNNQTINSISSGALSIKGNVVINNNNILNNSGFALANEDLRGTVGKDAKLNWWGTTNTVAIANSILDSSIDATRGTVVFEPISTGVFVFTATTTTTIATTSTTISTTTTTLLLVTTTTLSQAPTTTSLILTTTTAPTTTTTLAPVTSTTLIATTTLLPVTTTTLSQAPTTTALTPTTTLAPVTSTTLVSTTTTRPTLTTTTRLTLTTTTTNSIVTTTTFPDNDVALTAEFKTDVIGGFVPLTVTFTDLSTGSPASWKWEFGDGEISSEQNPIHEYDIAGEFTVRLTVTNANGSDSEEKIGLISADAPGDCAANFNADPIAGSAPLQVQFTDISTGSPTGWLWDFGDENVNTKQNPIHIYQTAGIFSVTLTIRGTCGSDVTTRTNLINVEGIPGPVADFSANLAVGSAPLQVQFTDTSTGSPTSWEWGFGDGDESTEQNPSHTYNDPGIYTPSLQVSNINGTDLEIKTNLINVDSGPEKLTVEFTASPQKGPVPLEVQFTDESTGNTESWEWDFGDGVKAAWRNPVHEYINEGLYNVTLTVNGTETFVEKNFIEILGPDEEPVAVFDAEPRTGNVPFTVHFFDKTSGDISGRIWDFGDGETSDEQDPAHTYETPGLFDVNLVISTDNGSAERLEEVFITVEDGVDPTAGFVADKNIGEDEDNNGVESEEEEETKKLTVKFSELSSTPDEGIIEREWDFGDGTKSSEKDPEHTFTGKEGDAFTISLAVANSEGFDTATKQSFIGISSSFVPGFVVGEIADKETGEVVEGVQCCIETKAGAEIVCVNTSKDGGFFLQVASGEYVFAATKDGFKKSRTDIVVKESDFETVNVELEMQQAGDDDDSSGKSFTFNCENDMEQSPVFGLEKLTMNVGETVNCTLSLANHESGKTVEIATRFRKRFMAVVEIEPERGVTDENGEMDVTITAIRKGKRWVAWAVQNDKGRFRFNKRAYDDGFAWAMSVRVK